MSSNESPNGAATVTPPDNNSSDVGAPSPRVPATNTQSVSDNAGVSPSSSDPQPSRPNHADQTQQQPQLNPRSCVTCRRRKVRCNKRDPCSNCVKAGIECVFPGPGRAPRKPRRTPDAELLSRLRRLEGVVESLGGAAAIDRLASANSTAPPPLTVRENNNLQASGACDDIFQSDQNTVQRRKDMHEEFGRLVIDEGRSQYVSNRFWASVGDQIEELQDILDPPSPDTDDYPSPGDSINSGSQSHDAFLFGYRSVAHTLRNYHPTPTQLFVLWKTYEHNVAPLVTVLHKPTIRNILVDASANPDSLDKNTEALAFSVYLAAVISMTHEQCVSELGEEREAAISRYRFATEQGLARANLLNSQNLTLIQAAILFLTCIRRQDDTRFVWTLSAVVLRLATGLGLHRDGTNFGLSPFETEMRRRAWWHICILDLRAAEDHGTDPMINDVMYDTRLPLNINDDDIGPDTKTPPPEREGCTDMTFSLIRCEVTLVYRRLTYAPPGTACPLPQTLEERDKMVERLNNRLNERYIRHCDMSIPLQWACATVARLIVAKLWLIVHHPLAKNEKIPALSQEARNRLLLTSIEILEFSHLLKTNENTARWGWLFRTHIQWHAVAFVLAELCVRPLCPGVDRAWAAVNSVFNDWEQQATQKKGMLWRPLNRLMQRAKEFRKKQQEELRQKYGTNPVPSSGPKSGFGSVVSMPQFSSLSQPNSSAAVLSQTPVVDAPASTQSTGTKGID
ncbi:C6 transcription factor, partial [Rasamsonia emersonii CBS 393.64]